MGRGGNAGCSGCAAAAQAWVVVNASCRPPPLPTAASTAAAAALACDGRDEQHGAVHWCVQEKGNQWGWDGSYWFASSAAGDHRIALHTGGKSAEPRGRPVAPAEHLVILRPLLDFGSISACEHTASPTQAAGRREPYRRMQLSALTGGRLDGMASQCCTSAAGQCTGRSRELGVILQAYHETSRPHVALCMAPCPILAPSTACHDAVAPLQPPSTPPPPPAAPPH